MKAAATYLCLGLLLVLVVPAAAQDIHFSQFQRAPMNLNPAMSGRFDGDWRLTANTRQQWRSVTNPYRTFGGSFDGHDFLKVPELGSAFSIYQDKAGDSEFSTLELNMAGSYGIRLQGSPDHTISIGVQSGITQRKINTANLTFDNQWNGSRFDQTLQSNELFANTSRMYANLNAGVYWTRTVEKRKTYSAGVSLYNILKPKQSFFADDNITLDRRLNLHVNTTHKITSDLDLQPGLLFSGQGTYRELDLGTNLRYHLDQSPYHPRAVYVGLWSRLADAGYIMAGMEYDNIHVAASYDFNYSPLRTASRWRGGLELSLTWIIRSRLPDRGRFKSCPDFI